MSDDHECRKCYEKTLEIVRKYLESQCRDGESLEAEVYGSYGSDCYLSIGYATIRDKKHITHSEHLPPDFLSKKFIRPLVPAIIDELLKHWRESAS